MATPERLMGVGVPNEVALRTGFFVHEVDDASGTRIIQGPGNVMVIVSLSATAVSLVLGSNFDIGDRAIIINRAIAVSLYGGTAEAGGIYPTSAAVVRALTSDVAREFIKGGAGVWYAIATA